MINFLLITIRNYWRNRFYTAINIVGLAIGLACFTGILAYTHNELNYDKHHSDSDKIFRIELIGNMSGTEFEAAVTGAPVGEILYNELPEVTLFTHFICMPRPILFDYNQKKIYQDGIVYADTSFFEMFCFDIIGDKDNALKEPYSLVMLESTARKYFGDENPIGRVVKLDNKTDYTVRAVIKEPLNNSHLDFQVLLSRSSLFSNPQYESIYNSMFAFTNFNYIKCTGKNLNELNLKVDDVFKSHTSESLKESGSILNIKLKPITDIHLKSNITHEINQNGNITTVYIFIVVAILIVVISSINYINLSIAGSTKRTLEVGVRQVFGASRQSIFSSFLLESIFLVVLSFILGVFFLQLITPLFDSISSQSSSEIIKNSTSWFLMAIIILLIGFAAGWYPAIFLSSLNPTEILKGKMVKGKDKLRFRNSMIVVQFTISIFLLCSTWLINRQINFINGKDLGFDMENVILLSLRNGEMINNYQMLKNELMGISNVEWVSASSSYIGSFNQRRGFYRNESTRKEMMMILNLQCDDNFLKFMGINILQGRDFLPEDQADENKIIVNETLVHEFGINDPIGKAFRLPSAGNESDDVKMEIIGVCKDFHCASLHEPVKPLIIWKNKTQCRYVMVKVSGSNPHSSIKEVSERWNQIFPDYPFEYFFLKENYNMQYKADVNSNRVFIMFTVLALAIACLGIFGLTAYTTRKRIREISIRKVLGANEKDIMMLISKDFMILIIISAIISIPASLYFIDKWLQNFSFRIAVGWVVFVVAPLFASFIALLTINIKVYFAAKQNPVESMRYE
jgi:putative ABC transport system permease protein